MQISTNKQFNEQLNDDPSREFETGIRPHEEKNNDPLFFDSDNSEFNHNPITNQQQNSLKQNRVQTQNTNQTTQNKTAVLTNKKQYIETIRLSYLVLGDSVQTNPSKKKKKTVKQTFAETSEEVENYILDDKIKEQLKSPLKLNFKKFKPQNKFIEQGEGLQIMKEKHWENCHMDIDMKTKELVVSDMQIPLAMIFKLKIYKPNQSRNQRQIKITYEKGSEKGVVNLNISEDKSIKKVSAEYVVFQQILVQKLTFQKRFKETKWQKQPHVIEQIMFQSYIFGQIYKKSRYLSKWEKRYVVLNGQGIFSYKSMNKKEEHTFYIAKQSIEYMWTRFDIFDGYLIIKVKHGLKKTQFGIPIAIYSYPHYKNWLYYFYRLMVGN